MREGFGFQNVGQKASPFNQQLNGEQGESRTENCSGNLASRQDSDAARSVHAEDGDETLAAQGVATPLVQ